MAPRVPAIRDSRHKYAPPMTHKEHDEARAMDLEDLAKRFVDTENPVRLLSVVRSF